MQTDNKNNQNIHSTLEDDYDFLQEINEDCTNGKEINASNSYEPGLKNSIIGAAYMICGCILILADSIGNINEIAETAAFVLIVFGFGITVYNLFFKN